MEPSGARLMPLRCMVSAAAAHVSKCGRSGIYHAGGKSVGYITQEGRAWDISRRREERGTCDLTTAGILIESADGPATGSIGEDGRGAWGRSPGDCGEKGGRDYGGVVRRRVGLGAYVPETRTVRRSGGEGGAARGDLSVPRTPPPDEQGTEVRNGNERGGAGDGGGSCLRCQTSESS